MASIAPLLLVLRLVSLPCAAGEDSYHEERRRLLLGQAEAARQVLEREPVNPDGKKYILEDYSTIDASAPDWSERMAKWIGHVEGYVFSKYTHAPAAEEQGLWIQERYDSLDRGESFGYEQQTERKDRMLTGELPLPPSLADYYRRHPTLLQFQKLRIQYRRRQTDHFLRAAVPDGVVLGADEVEWDSIQKRFGVTTRPDSFYLVLRPEGLAIQDGFDRKKETVHPYPAGWKRAVRKPAGGKPASVEELAAQVREFPDDEGLRGRLFAAARASRPDLPDEAIRFEGRAEAAVKSAKSPADFGKAAAEYRMAVDAAPWVAKYYYNLGLVLEKAGKPGEAIVPFKRYLAAAGRPDDALAVKKRIAGLEYMSEDLHAKGAEQQKLLALAGTWESDIPGFFPNLYALEMEGGDFTMRATQYRSHDGAWRSLQPHWGIARFRGRVDGGAVSGTVTIDYSSQYEGAVEERGSFSGELDPAGTTMRLRYTLSAPCCGWRHQSGTKATGGGWRREDYSAVFTKR